MSIPEAIHNDLDMLYSDLNTIIDRATKWITDAYPNSGSMDVYTTDELLYIKGDILAAIDTLLNYLEEYDYDISTREPDPSDPFDPDTLRYD